MDSSRRAVESYWRSRMIDGATADEDKVAPVYKLEEICELLRSSHVSIVKEVSEFILKRLDHKSPLVKQKALRLIKCAVGKSGVEFRREMQRHSAVVRQLFHYRGQPHPLKGDALNKAVRDTAHEAISAIFSEENNPAPSGNINRRIQGFGNTNFEPPSEDRKSFLSEVVGLGSASIKQGLNSFTQGHSLRKIDNGSYRSPHLHRSLTTENEYSDGYEPVRLPNETQGSLGASKNISGGPWGQGSRGMDTEINDRESSSSVTEIKTREERLLETIVTTGGVRLQPTRDAIQAFLLEAAKLDALALIDALESKLQHPMWQVRMKAVCVLESILRKKDDEHFSIITSYFCNNRDVVLRCSESPQASLREKTNKVLRLLDGEQVSDAVGHSKMTLNAETTSVQLPDLIDTGDSNDLFGKDESIENSNDQKILSQTTPTRPLIEDLFGDSFGSSASTQEQKGDDDPFADVSFHTNDATVQVDDLLSGMAADDNQVVNGNHVATHKLGPELFDVFGSSSEFPEKQYNHKNEIHGLMSGLSIDEKVSKIKQQESSPGLLESIFSNSSSHLSQVSNDALSGILGSQLSGGNANQTFSSGTAPYNMPPGMILNPAFHSQPINYAAMGNFLAHQQFLAAMSNFQHIHNLNAQDARANHAAGVNMDGYSSPMPDIFQSNFPNQAPTSMMNGSKKEETRAFDFISDHISANRDPKRVI